MTQQVLSLTPIQTLIILISLKLIPPLVNSSCKSLYVFTLLKHRETLTILIHVSLYCKSYVFILPNIGKLL